MRMSTVSLMNSVSRTGQTTCGVVTVGVDVIRNMFLFSHVLLLFFLIKASAKQKEKGLLDSLRFFSKIYSAK